MVLAHIPAAIDLVLLLWQKAIVKKYWLNPIGVVTQPFFAFFSLGAKLTNRLAYLLTNRTITIIPAYAVSFIPMVTAFYLGQRRVGQSLISPQGVDVL